MVSNPITDQYRLNTKTPSVARDISVDLVPSKNSTLANTTSTTQSFYSTIKNLVGFQSTFKRSDNLFSDIIYLINFLILSCIFLLISVQKQVLYYYHFLKIKSYNLIYYPNKSPEVVREDVNKLSKIPKILSVILDLKHNNDENGGIDGLIGNISELTAWSISSGIQSLVIYEYNGVIIDNYQLYLPMLIKLINKNLINYFGSEGVPLFSIKVPHTNLIIYSNKNSNKKPILEISLISRIDGKPTIVELTKTMSDLAINKELKINDITIELIDEELVELVGPEPDLLISFGPNLDLQDYPPWHIRLTEIYWEPDNKDVNYATYYRALQQFANCKLNVGK